MLSKEDTEHQLSIKDSFYKKELSDDKLRSVVMNAKPKNENGKCTRCGSIIGDGICEPCENSFQKDYAKEIKLVDSVFSMPLKPED